MDKGHTKRREHTHNPGIRLHERPHEQLREAGERDRDPERVHRPELVRGEPDEDAAQRGGDVEHREGQRGHLSGRASGINIQYSMRGILGHSDARTRGGRRGGTRTSSLRPGAFSTVNVGRRKMGPRYPL